MSKRIVVVGGGVGGTMLANQLVSKLYPEVSRGEVSVTLLSDSLTITTSLPSCMWPSIFSSRKS